MSQPASTHHDDADEVKPRWRGVSHQWAVPVCLILGVALAWLSPSTRGRYAAASYTFALVALFGVSASYHRLTWSSRGLSWMRRADHSTIFLFIAGSYAAVIMAGLPPDLGARMAPFVALGASVGIVQALFWERAPRFMTSLVAISLGWVVLGFWREVVGHLTALELLLTFIGGVAYTIGGVVFATKRPNPAPLTFGYHEVFHVMTLVGAGAHFSAIACMVMRSG
jgi:hemolysin III